MPDPAQDAADEEAEIQAMLLSLLTNRQDEPVAETSPLDQRRGAKAVEMMDSDFWEGEPMYYNPASSSNFTDQAVHDRMLQRFVLDAQHKASASDPAYLEAWEDGKVEQLGHPDWSYPEGTPPIWPERKPRFLPPEPGPRVKR